MRPEMDDDERGRVRGVEGNWRYEFYAILVLIIVPVVYSSICWPVNHLVVLSKIARNEIFYWNSITDGSIHLMSPSKIINNIDYSDCYTLKKILIFWKNFKNQLTNDCRKENDVKATHSYLVKTYTCELNSQVNQSHASTRKQVSR